MALISKWNTLELYDQSHTFLSNLEITVHTIFKIVLSFASYNINYCLVSTNISHQIHYCYRVGGAITPSPTIVYCRTVMAHNSLPPATCAKYCNQSEQFFKSVSLPLTTIPTNEIECFVHSNKASILYTRCVHSSPLSP